MAQRTAKTAPGSRRMLWVAAWAGMLWAVAAYAPASWLAAAVASATQQRVILADTQGIWRAGSARVVLSGGPQSRGATLAPGHLYWRIELGSLWRGQLGVVLNWPALAASPLRVQAQAAVGGWTVRQRQPADWRAHVPAALLEGLGTPWNTLALQGRVDVALREARVESAAGRLRLAGQVRVDAADMSSRLSSVSPLGTYRLQANGDGANATIVLSTLAGPLILGGMGVWNGRQLQFSGTAQAAAGQEQALANFLSLLGQREGDKVRIAL